MTKNIEKKVNKIRMTSKTTVAFCPLDTMSCLVNPISFIDLYSKYFDQ